MYCVSGSLIVADRSLLLSTLSTVPVQMFLSIMSVRAWFVRHRVVGPFVAPALSVGGRFSEMGGAYYCSSENVALFMSALCPQECVYRHCTTSVMNHHEVVATTMMMRSTCSFFVDD